MQEKFYTVSFCIIRCIAIFYPCQPRACSFYPEICSFFSEKKINLFPPRSCGILVVSKRVRAEPLPISPREMSTFREKNLHFHREKCPRFPRNLTQLDLILNETRPKTERLPDTMATLFQREKCPRRGEPEPQRRLASIAHGTHIVRFRDTLKPVFAETDGKKSADSSENRGTAG